MRRNTLSSKGSIIIEVPGKQSLVLKHLVLDYNGTLSKDGKILQGVSNRLRLIARMIPVSILTADTFGKAADNLKRLPVGADIIRTGADKAAIVKRLGANHTVAVGNGRNDVAMIKIAALGIAVIGPEGAAGELLRTADIVARDICEALELLLHPLRLTAALRK